MVKNIIDSSGSMFASHQHYGLIKNIIWFKKIFMDQMYIEGWDVDYGYNKKGFYIAVNGIKSTADIDAYNYARKYGFEVDANGNVLSFDKKNIKINKHLITGSELGLL